MNDLVIITGQTATGKTKLALDFALKLNGEIINADSRQVYTHLDIVTGKDREELKKSGVTVHLLDIVNPDQAFSSFDFVSLANPIIKDIWKRKKTPIIVGGSYLYIKHLLYGQDIKTPPNQKLRAKLEKKSVSELQNILLQLFNQLKLANTMNNSDWNNPRRLIRKIEILSNLSKSAKPDNPGGCLGSNGVVKMIGLRHISKKSLINKITKRVEKRLQEGAIDEVKRLLKMGYKKTDHGLQTIGYRQLIAYIDGVMTLEQAKENWINKEVQYAKRQLTFMKLDKNISWKEV